MCLGGGCIATLYAPVQNISWLVQFTPRSCFIPTLGIPLICVQQFAWHANKTKEVPTCKNQSFLNFFRKWQTETTEKNKMILWWINWEIKLTSIGEKKIQIIVFDLPLNYWHPYNWNRWIFNIERKHIRFKPFSIFF